MKSRLFVVNEETLIATETSGVAGIFVPPLTGQQWVKTISDIMADMLQIEIGDYIFLWETRTATQKSRIHGVYRVISKPYYEVSSPTDIAPFKIHIEKAYDFENPIEEYDVLNNAHIKSDLWTILGKKVAGKSRGTTPLSLKESEYLITMLVGANPNFKFIPFDSKRIVKIANPLNVTIGSQGANAVPTSLAALDPNAMHFFDAQNNVVFEKVLETIFNQEMTKRNKSFFAPLGINTDEVIWYSNYLPYSVEQSEMDYAIIESKDGINISKIYVVEFMKTEIDESHIHRSLLYSKWVNETLCLGSNVVEPILIAYKSVDFIHGETSTIGARKLAKFTSIINNAEAQYGVKPLKVFIYDFNNDPYFIRKK